MNEDPYMISYLLLLRFGPQYTTEQSTPLLNYTSIAKIVKRPVTTVKRLIMTGLLKLKHGDQITHVKRSKLTEEHIQYIKSDTTLRECAHLSLAQRARMFHRIFPEIKISPTLLARTYKSLGIKYKFIKRGKKIIDYSNQYYYNLFD